MSAELQKKDIIWFLETLVYIRVSCNQTAEGLCVLEHHAYQDDSPPLHIHHTEDEVFHMLRGTMRLLVDNEQHFLEAGDTLLVPKGTPHTYRIDSSEGGTWLTITTRGDFERFIRAAGRPADKAELPPRQGPPTPEMLIKINEAAKTNKLEIVGPPLL